MVYEEMAKVINQTKNKIKMGEEFTKEWKLEATTNLMESGLLCLKKRLSTTRTHSAVSHKKNLVSKAVDHLKFKRLEQGPQHKIIEGISKLHQYYLMQLNITKKISSGIKALFVLN